MHLPELVPALTQNLAICEGVGHMLLGDVVIDQTLALQRVLSLLEGWHFLIQVTKSVDLLKQLLVIVRLRVLRF